MDENDLKNELFYLAAYMVTSARGLYDEPADYGIFRLVDTAGRLLAIMEAQGLHDSFTNRLKEGLDEVRTGGMDEEAKRKRLDEMILEIAREMQTR